jgi:hypothetical protein
LFTCELIWWLKRICNYETQQSVSRKGDILKILKTGTLVVSALVALAGLIWMAQGAGYFPYPAESFMLNQTPWIWRGAMTTLVGVVGIVVARRL